MTDPLHSYNVLHHPANFNRDNQDPIWARIRIEAEAAALEEPSLSSFIYNIVLRHQSFDIALAHLLASRLGNEAFPSITLLDILVETMQNHPSIGEAARADILAINERDPSVSQYLTPFLYQKGFHGVQAYRVANALCLQNRFQTALYFQSRISETFSMDIHPLAKIGKGLMIDHAHSITVGETAVIGDNVSMLHEVTLGGTGKERGDRHPKIGDGVLIGAGAKILGNIRIGNNVRVGAGSVVLEPVPDGCTVVGVPAKRVNCPNRDDNGGPCWDMDHLISGKIVKNKKSSGTSESSDT